MKAIKFLSVALVALTLFSCSRDEAVTPGNGEPGEPTLVTVKLTGDGNGQPMSKVVGDVVNNEDTKINDYIVFIFRSSGDLDCDPYYSASSAEATIKATTAGVSAYVVANTGAFEGGLFENVKNRSDLNNVKGDLVVSDVCTQTKDNLWMSGTGIIENGSVTVKLSFLAARIRLVVKNNRSVSTIGVENIKDYAVALLNAGKDGQFFEKSSNSVHQTNFYAGHEYDWCNPKPAEVTFTEAMRDVPSQNFDENINGDVSHYFYTFGNNGFKRPTVIMVATSCEYNNKTITRYYPVRFVDENISSGFGIQPGNDYLVTMTLSGYYDDDKGIQNPEESLTSPKDVTVTIEAAKWTSKVIDKEIH
ncbi:fimbrial protein [uncultured Parabacteroides sp.]|jgi:hypothetical protein|uniref:fimbrial protein n=1 Tax=uncultured Parabacteroides sp. TaxID=512312 RepID=UPI0025D9492F|nr:fimbrial protein [uncultured Parabacteroides sp.]